MPDSLTIQSTKIAETDQGLHVDVTLADSPNVETAPNMFQIRAVLDTHEIAAPFVRLQIITLEHARNVIDAEIQRLRQREANSR